MRALDRSCGGILALASLGPDRLERPGSNMEQPLMRISLYLIIAVLLGSCSLSEDVVQDGPFQKRKYFKKGWFFDRPLKRGMEVLDHDELEVADADRSRDPYLPLIPAELIPMDPIDRNSMASLDLHQEVKPVPVGSIKATEEHQHQPMYGRKSAFAPKVPVELLPDPEVASVSSPLMITGFALLLPIAFLLALLLVLHRFMKNKNGATATTVALLMGLAGLAALAVI